MKLTRVYQSVLFAAIVAFILASCTRTSKDESYLGPKVITAPDGFQVLGDTMGFKFTNLGTEVDFTNGGVSYFDAKFSSEVSWQVEITNKRNGAKKTLFGTNTGLDLITSAWTGNADYQDPCDAKLTVTGYFDASKNIKVTSKSFVIGKGKDYNDGIKNHLIVDFEGGAGLATPYSDPLDGMLKSNPEYGDSAAHGKFSFRIAGNDINKNGYIAGVDMKNLVELTGKIKETNPSDVYLNMYVKGFGKQNTGLNILIYELDSLNVNSQASINGAKIIPESLHGELGNSTDRWIKEINVNWVGWKLVSIKYSEFAKPNNKGCNGNCNLEPHKLRAMSIGLDSYPVTGYEAEFAVDYIMFTEGGPFKP